MKNNGYHVDKKLYGIHSSNTLYHLFILLFVVWLDKHCMVIKIFGSRCEKLLYHIKEFPNVFFKCVPEPF